MKEQASDKKTITKTTEEKKAIQPESLLGSWVNKESEMGFTLADGGKCTPLIWQHFSYNSWQLI